MNWTEEQFAAFTRSQRAMIHDHLAAKAQPAPKEKYGNQRTTVDGITFQSKAEAKRYQELHLLAKTGDIHSLNLQPRFMLQEAFKDGQGRKHRSISYVGDFSYRIGEQMIVEDVKGKATETFRVKWKLAIKKYPEIEFRELRSKA